MDLQQIKQVIDLMKRADLTDFEIEEKDLKLRLRRDLAKSGAPVIATLPAGVAPAAPAPVATSAPATPVASAPATDLSIKTINSPMVGTFYASASPDAAPFVANGTVVKPDTVVCIIEAMKVMNEIQAEINGTIVETLVASGTSVEFGQPLFKVKVA